MEKKLIYFEKAIFEKGIFKAILISLCLLFAGVLSFSVFPADNSSDNISVVQAQSSVVYLNPNNVYNSSNNPYVGNDSNNGLSYTTPVLTLNNAYEILGGEGTIFFCKTLTISSNADIGWSERVTFKRFYNSTNANASNTSSLITITSGVTVSFTNITFDGFEYNISTNGGAIYAQSTSILKVNDCYFNNFCSQAYGGAIYFIGTTLTVEDCVFTYNIASYNSYGGGGGAIFSQGNTTCINSRFVYNVSRLGSGGAIFLNSSSRTLTITNCSFISNENNYSGYYGGGVIYCVGSSNISQSIFKDNLSAGRGGALSLTTGTFLIEDCSFENNKSTSNYGGAIYKTSGNLTVTDSTLISNFSSSYGGAIYSTTSGYLSLNNLIFKNNTSNSYGGAVYHYGGGSGSYNLLCSNSSFIGNSSISYGGAVFLSSSYATFTNTTFTGNSATSRGGAIYTEGYTLTCTNLIFRGNTPRDNVGSIYNSNESSTSLNNCLFDIVYLNPNSVYNEITNPYVGNKKNEGASYQSPVLSLDNAYEIIGGVGTIYLCNPLIFTSSENIGWDETITIKRFYDEADVNGSNTSQLIYINSGVTVNISNIIFDGNEINLSANGGAIYSEGTLNCVDCTFINNKTSNNGSAIYSTYNVTCTNTKFYGNNPSGQEGAIFCGGISDLINCEFNEVVYLNSNGAFNLLSNPYVGSNSNNGLTYKTPVQTLAKAYEILGGEGVIYLCKTYTISSSTNIGWEETVKIKRFYDVNDKPASNEGSLLTINSGLTVNISNIIFDGMNVSVSVTGASVYSNGSTLTVEDCSFINNNSSSNGAGIYSTGVLTCINTIFSNNFSSNYGGAIYVSNHLTMTDCNFTNNKSNSYGGAIYSNSGTITMTDCNFINNFASGHGGVIFSNSGTITMTGCNFTNNKSNSYGGAIFSSNLITVESCEFTNNKANSYGGAIYNQTSYAMICNNSTFTGNSATQGGAIHCYLMKMDNNTFSENSATTLGGAIVFSGYSYSSTIDNCLFSLNSSNGTNGGGAIYSQGQVRCEYSTFAENTSVSNGAAIYGLGTTTFIRTNFNRNTPSGSAGAIFSSSLFLSDCNFNAIFLNPDAEYDETTNPYVGSDDNNGLTSTLPVLTLSKAIQLLGGEEGTIILCKTLTFSSNQTINNLFPITIKRFINDNNNNFSNNSYLLKITSLATVSISNVTFDGLNINMDLSGGAIYNEGVLTLNNSRFINNSTTSSGGAIYNISSYALTIDNCLFSSNYTNLNGGAIYSTSAIVCSNSQFINNIATSGGAIYCTDNVTCTNSIFEGNIPFGQAGAIFCDGALSFSEDNVLNNIVYLNPNTQYNENTNPYAGSDYNNGGMYSPVSTLLKAYELLGGEGTIYMCKTLTISTDSTIGWSERITIKRYYDINNEPASNLGLLILINATLTVSFSNITFDGSGVPVGVNGGAINNLGTLTLTNCSFENNYLNSNYNGGAIYSVGSLTLNNCTFNNNYSNNYGGAVYVNSNLTITTSTFTNNKSNSYYGGAIFTNSSSSNISCSSSTFTNNSTISVSADAGAIYSSGTMTLLDCEFYGNTTVGSSAWGGAISCRNTTTITNTNFENNSSYSYAGAIYFANSSGAILTIDNCDFINNISTNSQGGVIYFTGSNSSKILIKDSNFTDNSSTNAGGVIYFKGSTSASLTIETSIFTNNKASSNGNVVYFSASSSASSLTLDCCEFINNTGNGHGGVIYFSNSASALIINDCIFLNNQSGGYGGVILLNYGNLICTGATSFIGNSSSNYGGVLCTGDYNSNCEVSFTGTSFTENSSTYYGGVIYSPNINIVNFTDCVFTGNSAINRGGAIYLSNSSTVLTIDNCDFSENLALGEYGGAIFCTSILNLTNSTFAGNVSPNGGAIYISSYPTSTLTIEGCTFSNNYSSGNGGTIYISVSITLQIINSEFTENVSTNGGAIYSTGSVTCTGQETLFKKNSASSGGAIYALVNVSCTETTFDRNSPLGEAGAIFCNGTKSLIDCIIINLNAVYVNAISGNDSNDGQEPNSAVLTLVKALEIIGEQEGTIYICKTITISSSITLGSEDYTTTIRRYYNPNDPNNSNSSGLLNIGSGVTATFTNLIFDGSGLKVSTHGVAIYCNSSSNITFNNCSFINNKSPTTSGYQGGAIYSQSSVLTLNGCSFEGNEAYYGGAIYSSGTLNCNETTFTSNLVYYYGGAIFVSGNLNLNYCSFDKNSSTNYAGAIHHSTGSAIIENCSFTNNFAISAQGGAIRSTGTLICKNTEFINNYSYAYGGAISFENSSSTLRIEDCYFIGNRSTNSSYYGGAIYCTGTLICLNSDFSGNTSSTRGGAIYFSSATNILTIDNCNFTNNKCTLSTSNPNSYGGAIYNKGILNISSTTFSGNETYNSGGAIYSERITTCIDSSFLGNKVRTSGGAIYCLSNLTCTRTIFKNNTPKGQSGAIFCNTVFLINCEFNTIYLNADTNFHATTNPYLGSDTNDGLTYTTPVLTLLKALELIGDDEGKIVLCKTLKITENLTLSPTYPLTITRYYNENNLNVSNLSNMIEIFYSSVYVNFSNVIFDGDNVVVNVSGGAIYNKGNLNCSNCTFTNNSVIGSGGAIYGEGIVYCTDSIFKNNSATIQGGAIYATANVTCIRCIFEGNKPNGEDGAVKTTGTLTKLNCEFRNVVYLNSNSVFNISTNPFPGSDSNNGSISSPILTLTKAYQILAGEGTVYLFNKVTISSNSNFNWSETVTLKRYYDSTSIIQTNTSSLLQINTGVTVSISNFIFDGNNVTFDGNGGAIYNLGTLTLTNCYFINNVSSLGGGAIYSAGALTLSNTNFTNNRSAYGGGAIYMDNSVNLLNINLCTFDSNSSNVISTGGNGGAIYSKGPVIIKNTDFIANSSTTQSGAVYVNSITTFEIENCNFTGNYSAQSGGGLFINGCSSVIVKNCTFTENSSVSGYEGNAIYISGSSSVTTISITGTDFIENFGGTSCRAIYLINLLSATIDNCNFTSNTGGSIFFSSNNISRLTVVNSFFTNNSSSQSGGITIQYGTLICENTIFTGNSSTNEGGAIRQTYAGIAMTIIDSKFISNTSNSYGGAVYQSSSTTPLSIDNCEFTNNYASTYGGAIYNASNTVVENSTFTGNYVNSNHGGAIYISDSTKLLTTDNCFFTYNTAKKGGAIFNLGETLCTGNSSFINNTAVIWGGAIYGVKNITLIDVFFKGNLPKGQNGAVYCEGLVFQTNCEFLNIVYLDPINGDDDNDGKGIGINEDGSEAPLLSIDYAIQYLEGHGIIYLCKPMTISTNMSIGVNNYDVIVMRMYDENYESFSNTGYMFIISSNAVVHFKNVTIDGDENYVSSYSTVRVTDTAQVYFDENTGFQNCFVASDMTSGIVVEAGARVVFGDMKVQNTNNNFMRVYGNVEINSVYAENWGLIFANITGSSASFSLNRATFLNGGRVVHNASLNANNIIIKNSIFKNCVIGGAGGAISSSNADSTILIENSTFENCSSLGNPGGAIFISGSANVTIDDCVFINNTASGNYGSHVRILPTSNDGVYTFSNCSFSGGSSFKGGAIYITNTTVSYYSIVNINNCAFDNLKAGAGAGIYVVASTLTITDCDFTNNTNSGGEAGNYGTVVAFISASFTMTNCEVSNNIKRVNTTSGGENKGGGIYIALSTTTATVTITDSKINNNTVLGTNAIGGGLYVESSTTGGSVTLTNTEISGNYSAYNAGGAYLYLSGTGSIVTINNCDFSNNVAENYYGAIVVGKSIVNHLSTFTMEDSTFNDNLANVYGVGYFVVGNNISLLNNIFDSNETRSGVSALFIDLAGALTMDNCTFTSNSATGGAGALYLAMNVSSSVTVINSKFNGNTAGGNGGAINISGAAPSSASFDNCEFNNNSTKGTGGAIYSTRPLTFTNCNFTSNSSKINGGAIFVTSTLTISNCVFDGNNSVEVGGALYAQSTTTINDSVFRNNMATTEGGAMKLQGASTLNRVEIYNNQANSGGGVHVIATTTLNNCNIYNNTAISNGGGVYANAIITFNSCNIYGNITGNNGGGVYVYSSFRSYFYSCNIYNNEAYGNVNYSGGGIYVGYYMTLSDCNIYGNYGTRSGGGIVVWDSSSIINCKFYNNTAGYYGGGLYVVYGINVIIDNCEFSNNTAQYGSAIYEGEIRNSTKNMSSIINNCSFINNTASIQGTVYVRWITVFVDCIFSGNVAPIGSVVYSSARVIALIGTTYYTDSSFSTVGGTLTENQIVTTKATYCTSGSMYFKTSDLLALEESTGEVNYRKVTFTNCEIKDNVSTSGGMIYSASDEYFPAQLTMTGCEISDNSDGEGASLQVENFINANITNCTFTNNTGGTAITDGTKNGGGVSVGGYAILNITDCTFLSNIDQNMVFAKANGNLFLTNPNITSSAIFTRGVIETAVGSKSIITGGTISGLTGIYASAMYLCGETVVKDIVVTNCKAVYGGAIYVGENAKVTLNATISYNSGLQGRGLYVAGNVTMTGGTINNNTGHYNPDNVAVANAGGGVYVANGGTFTMQGIKTTNSNGVVSYSYGVIEKNYNGGVGGGGIYVASGGYAVINYGTISENSVLKNGGGVYVESGATFVTGENALIYKNYNYSGSTGNNGLGVYNAGTMVMNGGTISENYYSSGTTQTNGGGIYSAENSSLTINNATIYKNKVYSDGGAIYISTGCVASIENTTIKNSWVNTESGGAIYAKGAYLKINNVVMSGNYNCLYGTISAYNSNVIIKNSEISYNKTARYSGIYFSGISNNLTIEDTLFKENTGTADNLIFSSNLYVKSANKVFIKDTNFLDGVSYGTSDNLASIMITNTKIFEMIGCLNLGNIQQKNPLYASYQYYGGISISGTTDTQGTIKDCVFNNNISSGSGGALSIIVNNPTSVINISDCSFTGNQSTGYYDTETSTWLGGNGGAIYLGGNATVNFSGDIEISGNFSRRNGGGIYVNDTAKPVIKKGTNFIVRDNFVMCSEKTESVTINGTAYDIVMLEESSTKGNFYIQRNTAISLFEGNLADDSELWLDFVTDGDKIPLSAVNNYNCILTLKDVEKLHSDNLLYTFKLNTITNQIEFVLLESTLQVIANDLVYVKKNRTLTDDGKYGVTASDLQVLNASGNVTVQFYATSSGTAVSDTSSISSWASVSPRFGNKGSYIIYYKVTNGVNVVIGNLTMRILGEKLFIEEAPVASLKYGETLSRAIFSGWEVMDEKGNYVTGTWVFVSSTTIPTNVSTLYQISFIPYRTNYYEQSVSTSILVNIGYDLVFYKPSAQENAGGEFYINESCTISTTITTLGMMISYLNKNGTIIFVGTYQVGAGNNLSETISVDKTIYLIRHSSAIASPILEVLHNTTQNYLTIIANNGRVVFEGAGQYSGIVNAQASAILNNGVLNFGMNVIFRNFVSQGVGESGAMGSVINNGVNGTLILNGCEIYGNTATNSVTNGTNLGGAIYNAGTMVVNSGKFFANSTADTGGKGGFVYTVGKLIMNGGEIYANSSNNGGAVCVAQNGEALFNGGVLRFNTATNSGGGCYVENGGEAVLNGTEIFSNRAGSEGGGIFSDGTLYNESTGNTYGSATLDFIESQNDAFSDFGEATIENESYQNLTIFGIIALLLGLLILLRNNNLMKKRFVIKR